MAWWLLCTTTRDQLCNSRSATKALTLEGEELFCRKSEMIVALDRAERKISYLDDEMRRLKHCKTSSESLDFDYSETFQSKSS
jgi:hypothetical protein